MDDVDRCRGCWDENVEKDSTSNLCKPCALEIKNVKPCPFCGGKEVETETNSFNNIVMGCMCGCYGASSEVPIDALKNWNKRA